MIKSKKIALRGSELFPLRAVPYGMDITFVTLGGLSLNVTIFITHVRSYANAIELLLCVERQSRRR